MTRFALALVAAISLSNAALADAIRIPWDVMADGWKAAECTLELQDEEREGENLGGGLQLVEVRCWSAAYQAGSILFAVDPAAPEKARLLRFQVWDGKRLVPALSLTEPSYDPDTKTLGSAHKGRGVGDCGTIGEWKWTGTEFKLTSFWSKPKCDNTPFDDNKRWQVFPRRR